MYSGYSGLRLAATHARAQPGAYSRKLIHPRRTATTDMTVRLHSTVTTVPKISPLSAPARRMPRPTWTMASKNA